MAETTVAPLPVPVEALTLADKTRRIDRAQLFFARLAESMGARARNTQSAAKQRELHQQAFEELDAYLCAFGPLQLLVGEAALVLFGDPVTQSSELADIAGRLHAAGMHKLTFLPGIASDELSAFADLMLAPPAPQAWLADRLWEARLAHVQAMPAVAFAIPGMSEGAVAAEVGRIAEGLFEALRQNAGDLRRFLQGDPAASDVKGEALPCTAVIAGAPASEALKARLQEAIARDEAETFDKAIGCIFRHLESGRAERLEAVEAFLADLVDGRLRLNDLAGIAAIVRRVEGLEYRPEQAMIGYRLRCFLQGQLSKPERLNPVIALLVQGRLEDPESVRCYLGNLDADAVPPLIDLLPSISLPENREIAREALIRAGKGTPEPFVEALKSDRGEIARDMLHIIDACDFTEKFSCFEAALQSRDRALQIEALELCAKPENAVSEPARRLLIGALGAGEAALRLAALQGLKGVSSPRVGKALLDAMQSPSFAKRDFEERQRFFEALGNLNLPAALPYLSSILSQKKRGLFGHARQREDKLLAICALSRMVMIPAYKIIQGAAEDESNDGKVREEARAALAMMRRALFGGSTPGHPG